MQGVKGRIEFSCSDQQLFLEFTGDTLVHVMGKTAEAVSDLADAVRLLAEAESTSVKMRSELGEIVSKFAGAIDTFDEDETRL